MKLLFKILLSLVVVVIIGAVTLPFLIPVETYKEEITKRVREQTGRELIIAGDIKASAFPNIGVDLTQVSFSNPAGGYSTKNMAELDKVQVEVALLPLLKGDVQVKRFILEKPVINLEVNAAGKPNWEFAPKAAPASAAPKKQSSLFISAANAAELIEQDQLAGLRKLSLGEVEIRRGLVSYIDQRSKQRLSAKDVDLQIGLERIDAPLTIVGNATWNDEVVKLDGKVDTLKALLDGKEAAVVLKANSKPLELDYTGKATNVMTRGNMSLAIASIPALAKWTGSPMDWKGQGPLKFSARGNLACSAQKCGLEGADISLDDVKAKGDVGVVFTAVPTLTGKLAIDALNVNSFMAPAQKHSGVLGLIVSDAHAATGWSRDPIDLSGLRNFNADIALVIGSLLYDEIRIGKTVTNLKLNGGQALFSIAEMALYGGSGKGSARVDAAGNVSKELTFTGVQAEPFLKDATGDDRLSGTAALQLNVSTRGGSQEQMVGNLSGNGSLIFTDGAIKGINLAQMVRNVKSAFTADKTTEKTDFAELGGTFTIAQGIVSNNDLAMKAPLLRLSGNGTINLPMKLINYRLVPELVNTLKGQGGKEKEGLAVPVIVEGPLDKPTYRPDLASVVQDAVNNPEKIKETVKDIKTQIKENKTDLKDLKNNPDAVKDLLKGFGR